MTKDVMRVTVAEHKRNGEHMLEYTVENKTLEVNPNNKVFFHPTKSFYVTDEPYIELSFPTGKVMAYGMNVKPQEMVDKIIAEMLRSKKRKIAMFARKADTRFIQSSQRNQERCNKAIEEYKEFADLVNKHKIYEVSQEEFTTFFYEPQK